MSKHKMGISRDEWLVIGVIVTVAILFIAFLPSIMNSSWFTGQNPPIQYLAFNIGFILITIVVFGIPTSLILKQKVHLSSMLRGGISSWLIFSLMLDMWQPPFTFSPSGQQLITKSESLVGTSVDYMVGWIYLHLPYVKGLSVAVPFEGQISLLFILIYFFTPILAVLLAALILKPKTLARMIRNET